MGTPTNELGGTTLPEAAHKRRVEVVKVLVELGADVTTRMDQGGDMALHAAAGKIHVECVQALVRLQADVNANNRLGGITLHQVAHNRRAGGDGEGVGGAGAMSTPRKQTDPPHFTGMLKRVMWIVCVGVGGVKRRCPCS